MAAKKEKEKKKKKPHLRSPDHRILAPCQSQASAKLKT